MATLLLTAVGTAVGGPIGGALGALVGQQVDGAVFGTGSKEGPRISDLSVTTSTYGQAVPRIFGTMRVPGCIIWSTDLLESSETNGNGKGQPKTTTYSYSISFAVAISSRPIAQIGRIWADGNLLRGAAGDLKTAGELRVYDGYGDQAVDPLIGSDVGDECPGFRGMAYAVFENLQLADFGNRIPALTFEVMAGDANEISLRELVPVASSSAETISQLYGYSDRGGALLNTLETINRAFPIDCSTSQDGLSLSLAATNAGSGAAATLPQALLEESEGARARPSERNRQRSAATLPEPRALRYFDVERDYQAGVQRTIGVAASGQEIMLELPAAMVALDAREVCNRQTLSSRWQRETMTWQIAEVDASLAPGTNVLVPGHAGTWSIQSWEWMERGVALELKRAAPSISANVAAPSGYINPSIDALASATQLAIFELPWDGLGSSTERQIFTAAAGTGDAWSGAALYVNQADQLVSAESQASRSATIAHLATSLPPSPALCLEKNAWVEIEFAHANAELTSTTTFGLASGANRWIIGDEIIQFLCAEAVSSTKWRLTGLLRGRGGTEAAAMAGHALNTMAVLVNNALVKLDSSLLPGSGNAEIAAIGLGDEEPVYAAAQVTGLSRLPLSPVHARQANLPDGSWELCWTRRARGQWLWQDYIDTPLIEESESYLVGVGPPANPDVSWQTNSPSMALSSTEVANLIQSHAGADVWVCQLGTYGNSPATKIATIATIASE